MSSVNSSVSTDILERRHHHVEKPLLDFYVLTIYYNAVVNQRSVLRVGVWREMSSSVNALETIWRHFFQSDRARAFTLGLRNRQDVKVLTADGLAYRRSLADGSSINTYECKMVCPS